MAKAEQFDQQNSVGLSLKHKVNISESILIKQIDKEEKTDFGFPWWYSG